VIGDLFQRYYSLITASSMAFMEPVIQHDWLAPFRVPWIRQRGLIPRRRAPVSGTVSQAAGP
jgi:hypothetical protein